MGTCIEIVDWDKHYENNRTRELKRMEWVPIPNRHDGSGYRELISSEHGTEIFAAWIVILQVASRCSPRGCLAKSNGDPHDARSLSLVTGLPEVVLAMAIERLGQVGWIANVEQNRKERQFPPGAIEKKRAHGRVNHALSMGRAMHTPFGEIIGRPDRCQWCDRPGRSPVGQNAPTIAHHLEGYGDKFTDLFVIFLCRSCHQLFERNGITSTDVKDRLTQGNAKMSQPTAAECPLNGTELNGTELNGREGKRTSKIAAEAAIEKKDPRYLELYGKLKSAFESKNAEIDYKREGPAMKWITEHALTRDDPNAFLKSMLNLFWTLTHDAREKIWYQQPFIPSVMRSGGLWPRLLTKLQDHVEDSNAAAQVAELTRGWWT